MTILRTILPMVSLLTTGAVATAHPIPIQHHDRTVLIRVTDSAIVIEYTLALDALTQAKDLYALREQIDRLHDLDQMNRVYAELYGPRLANGIVVSLDGHALNLTYGSHQLKIEDHLRYLFTMRASRKWSADHAAHRLRVVDSNFAMEPGTLRLALRGDDRVLLQHSNVPEDPERARPLTLADLARADGEKLRTAEATFVVSAADGKPSAAAPWRAPPDSISPSFREVLTSLDLRRLIDSDMGMALLLALAFVFGAAHALQPGHGKTLVAAYLVGEQGTVAHAFFLGLVTTLTHTSSAILLALVIPLFYSEAESEVSFFLELGCGLLIVFMALWLLLRRLSGQADHVHLFGGHHHHHGDHVHHHHGHAQNVAVEKAQKVSLWALITLGITGGLVPCVDALALLTLTFTAKKVWLGLPLILAFSAGLASVLVTVGVLVVRFKRFADSRWGHGRFVKALPIAAAAVTLLLGVWMCREALRNHEVMLRTQATQLIP